MTPEPTFDLTCLLCGDEDTDLVAMQAHGLAAHGITPDQLRLARRHGASVHTEWGELDMYTWTLPDGRVWLGASRRHPPQEARHAP